MREMEELVFGLELVQAVLPGVLIVAVVVFG